MVWGQAAAGISDLVQRVADNDPKLTSLHILRFRQLTDESLKALCHALRSNTTLLELSCSSHAISTAAAAAVGEALGVNTTLKSLSVGNSNFGDEAFAALCKGLCHNSSLTSLDCENKGLTNASGAALGQLLQQHPALQALNLSRNQLGDSGIAALQDGWRCLRKLQLGDCGLTAEGVAALGGCTSLPTLTHLDLSHNHLGPTAGQSLAHLLAAAKALQQLRLQSTQLGDEDLDLFMRLLSPAPQLQQLDLSSSGCSARGCAAVAAALAQLPSLTGLDLSHNPGVTDEAVQQLATGWAAACSSSSSSQHHQGQPQQQQQRQLALDLAGCGLADGAVAPLLSMAGLTSLNMMGAKLTAAGAEAIASTLAASHVLPLRDLNLCACQLPLEALEQLLPAAAAFAASAASRVAAPAPLQPAATAGVAEQGGGQQQHTVDAAVGAGLVLAIGGNPGVQADGFEALLEGVLADSCGLVVHWRAGTDQEQQ